MTIEPPIIGTGGQPQLGVDGAYEPPRFVTGALWPVRPVSSKIDPGGGNQKPEKKDGDGKLKQRQRWCFYGEFMVISWNLSWSLGDCADFMVMNRDWSNKKDDFNWILW